MILNVFGIYSTVISFHSLNTPNLKVLTVNIIYIFLFSSSYTESQGLDSRNDETENVSWFVTPRRDASVSK